MLFAGGGTGGHLYPGLAIARALKGMHPEVDPFFVGARRGVERDVLPTTEFPHELLDLHPLYRSRLWENWRTVRGAASAWQRLASIARAERPRCVVGTGGYASGLALLQGKVSGIPLVVQEQNSFPGLTTRFMSRYARQVHIGFPESTRYLSPGRDTRVLDSGNPIEPPPEPRPSREASRASWNFPEQDGRVLLVYGGSQGALAINRAVQDWIRAGLPPALHVIWATGRQNYDAFADLESEYVRVRPYLSPIASAYAAADFAISRAGAMATAELCAWGIPQILIPLPTAAADHQTANAKALAAAGAAEVIPQRELTAQALDATVRRFLDDPDLLRRRSAGAVSRARPHAARAIATEIASLLTLG